jgi:hypothetical protein
MPDPEFTSYDREVLYEQVWAEPPREDPGLRLGAVAPRDPLQRPVDERDQDLGFGLGRLRFDAALPFR